MPKITLENFADSFGTSVADIREKCLDLISKSSFDYSIIDGIKRDELILNILKRIDLDQQKIASTGRQEVWDKGWQENLEEFITSNYDLNKLIPKFIRSNQPVRYNSEYIQPLNSNFELDYYSVFRDWLYKSYFSEFSSVYEFGCGTGFNLVALAQLYPEKKLYGLDFVTSSVNLVNEIAKHCKYNLSGHLFDMISPKTSYKLSENSIVFTIGSIEQLASNFEAFIQYLLNQPISLCIHVEPTIELYNENNLVDHLAIKFQGKRGYTKNLLPYLETLKSENKIKILKMKRLNFGSLFMEGYNCMIWSPIKK